MFFRKPRTNPEKVGVVMADTNALEALRLVSDWAKWLITIEAGAIAIIGGAFSHGNSTRRIAKVFATAAVTCFVCSITVAAILLLTLPEIAQSLQPDINIWLTQDSVIGRVLGLNTQDLAMGESVFFGVGIICFAAMIVTTTWS